MQDGSDDNALGIATPALWDSFARDVRSAVGSRHGALLDAGGEVASEYLKLVRSLVERYGPAEAARASGIRGIGGETVSGHGSLRLVGPGQDQGVDDETVRSSPVVEGDGSPAVAGDSVEGVSKKTLANRAKRVRRKAAAKAESARNSVPEVPVLEWRRKDAGALVHKGVFSECSAGTQVALRESRARMLIAKNEAAVVESEHKRRQSEARMKARLVEEEVERSRLRMDAELKKLRSQREDEVVVSAVGGFAETIASALSVPSSFDESVSPDSSVSVAELHKKDQAIRMLVSDRKASDERIRALEAKCLRDRESSDEKIRALEARCVNFGLSRGIGAMRMGTSGGSEPVKRRQGGGGGYSSWECVEDGFDHTTSCMN